MYKYMPRLLLKHLRYSYA